MDSTFQVTLEHVEGNYRFHNFRLAFHSSKARVQLPYPKVTALRIRASNGNQVIEWKTNSLVSGPLDTFVLNPGDRIAFDLRAHTESERDDHRWTIPLPNGQYHAQYVADVNQDIRQYELLAKRSRFIAMTKPWCGTLKSNEIQFISENTKPDL